MKGWLLELIGGIALRYWRWRHGREAMDAAFRLADRRDEEQEALRQRLRELDVELERQDREREK
jgi:hypothetical protein